MRPCWASDAISAPVADRHKQYSDREKLFKTDCQVRPPSAGKLNTVQKHTQHWKTNVSQSDHRVSKKLKWRSPLWRARMKSASRRSMRRNSSFCSMIAIRSSSKHCCWSASSPPGPELAEDRRFISFSISRRCNKPSCERKEWIEWEWER